MKPSGSDAAGKCFCGKLLSATRQWRRSRGTWITVRTNSKKRKNLLTLLDPGPELWNWEVSTDGRVGQETLLLCVLVFAKIRFNGVPLSEHVTCKVLSGRLWILEAMYGNEVS